MLGYHLLAFGLAKEEVCSLYAFPDNSKLLTALKVNLELELNLSSSHSLRDETHCTYQFHLSKALSALRTSFNSILENERGLNKLVKKTYQAYIMLHDCYATCLLYVR